MTTEKPKNQRVFEKLTEGSYEGLSIYRNTHSKFQPSYVAYLKDDKTRALNISGFPARQLAKLNIEEMPNYIFDIEVELSYSQNFNVDYLLITKVVKHKKLDTIQQKLEIEGED
jgi:hypothetical protein